MANRAVEISRTNNIQTKIIIDEDSRDTTAEVAYLDLFNDKLVIGRGKARWNPIDFFDPQIGKGIALGRALAKFGKNYAKFWQTQSGSIGEHKAAIKANCEVQELGEVYYALAHRPEPKVEKFPSPERMLEIENERKKAKDYKPIYEDVDDAQVMKLIKDIQKPSQESKRVLEAEKTSILDSDPTALKHFNENVKRTQAEYAALNSGASDVVLDNLDTVIETNRTKLETPNKGGQHISK